jgi:LytS/YehU family sensor histidine kinase
VLHLKAERGSGMLRVTIENPRDPDAPVRRGSGLGQRIVRERLRTEFGDDGTLEAVPSPRGYRVELRLPARPA